jgi:hypothetical protein
MFVDITMIPLKGTLQLVKVTNHPIPPHSSITITLLLLQIMFVDITMILLEGTLQLVKVTNHPIPSYPSSFFYHYNITYVANHVR